MESSGVPGAVDGEGDAVVGRQDPLPTDDLGFSPSEVNQPDEVAGYQVGEATAEPADDLAELPDVEEAEIAGTAAMVAELVSLASRLDELGVVLASQGAAIAQFHERSVAQEQLITKLHDRVQTLQAGETKHLIKPVVGGLVALYGEILTQVRGIQRDLSQAEMQELLEVLGVRVENTLATLGVESYGAAVGDPFNPRSHQAIDVVATDLPDQHQTIAAVLRPGFQDPTEPRPMFAAQVTVSKYVQPKPSTELDVAAPVDTAADSVAPTDATDVSQTTEAHQKESK